MTLGKGADQIDLYYFGPGHTNGDAWVVFPAHRIVHAGDISPGRDCRSSTAPTAAAAALPGDADEGVPRHQERRHGHQRPQPAQTTWADLKEFAEFNQDFLTFGAGAVEGRQDPGTGGGRVEGAREVQGLFRHRVGGRQRPEDTLRDSYRRDEEVSATSPAAEAAAPRRDRRCRATCRRSSSPRPSPGPSSPSARRRPWGRP